jgi:type II secretory pathway pseudopilin PulG
MIALAVVGALLVAAINAYTTTLRTTSEIEQLKNLLNVVAAKGTELLTIAASTNSSTQVFLQLPATIGHQQYWMRAGNDSSSTWIEGALGPITHIETQNRVFLPQGASASGSLVGGYGPAVLESYMNGSTPQLNIASLGG